MSKADQIRALREMRYAEMQQQASVEQEPVINVINTVTDKEDVLLTSNADRQAKWRKANAALNRERARDGMRKKRAEAKA